MPYKEKNAFNLGCPDLTQRKIADITFGEFMVILEEIQAAAIERALMKVLPQTDPDENVYMTAKEAAAILGVSRQTIQEKKSKMLLEFYGEGRIQRTTLAAVKRYLKKFGTPLSKIKLTERRT